MDKPLQGISPHRNCKRCPTYQATQGHGSTACVPCQQRGLYLTRYIPPPDNEQTTPYVSWASDIGQALIEDLGEGCHYIDIIAAIRVLPPQLSAIMSMYCMANLTQREIARTLKITQPAVFNKIQQAAKIIKLNLDKITKSPAALISLKKRGEPH